MGTGLMIAIDKQNELVVEHHSTRQGLISLSEVFVLSREGKSINKESLRKILETNQKGRSEEKFTLARLPILYPSV